MSMTSSRGHKVPSRIHKNSRLYRALGSFSYLLWKFATTRDSKFFWVLKVAILLVVEIWYFIVSWRRSYTSNLAIIKMPYSSVLTIWQHTWGIRKVEITSIMNWRISSRLVHLTIVELPHSAHIRWQWGSDRVHIWWNMVAWCVEKVEVTPIYGFI
jgi:hypothetical protein